MLLLADPYPESTNTDSPKYEHNIYGTDNRSIFISTLLLPNKEGLSPRHSVAYATITPPELWALVTQGAAVTILIVPLIRVDLPGIPLRE